jgi:hypothetical protein
VQSTPLFGLQQFEETDLVELGDGLVGKLAKILRGLSALADERQQIIDAI